MLSEELDRKIQKKAKKALKSLSKEYGELFIKIEVLNIFMNAVTLRVFVVNKEGKVVVNFADVRLMKNDTVNIDFNKQNFRLTDFVSLTFQNS